MSAGHGLAYRLGALRVSGHHAFGVGGRSALQGPAGRARECQRQRMTRRSVETLIAAFESAEVRYLIVGGLAVEALDRLHPENPS